MKRQELFNGFELDYHEPRDQHVKPVAHVQGNDAVLKRHRHLRGDTQPTLGQLVSETDSIRALQQARAKTRMYSQGRVDEVLRDRVLVHGHSPLRSDPPATTNAR